MQIAIHTILRLEPYILGAMTFAFWYPTPTPTDWLPLLVLIPLFWLARWRAEGRPIARTPLDAPLLALVIIGALNVALAPYTRGLLMLGRPLLGIALFYALIAAARRRGGLDGLMQFMVGFGLFAALLALGTTQWNEKADALRFLIDPLPRISNFPGLGGGFNGNEIAGGLAWLAPLIGGLAAWRWRRGLPFPIAGATFVLLALALFLGQSRGAIAGVVLALALISVTIIPRGLGRWAAWAGLLIFVGIQGYLVFGGGASARTTRDEVSAQGRLAMWARALEIVRDHPLTGVGLSMYRDGRVGAHYPIPGYENRPPPHTHNEFLQFGTDMGVPGWALFLWLYGAAAWMLARVCRAGDDRARAYAVAVGAGLLAHAVFGLVDAITLWDRLAFIFWLMLGLVGALDAERVIKPDQAEK